MKDVLLRAVYDKVENTLSFYQSDLESTAAASTNAMADAPNIFLDLNQNIEFFSMNASSSGRMESLPPI